MKVSALTLYNDLGELSLSETINDIPYDPVMDVNEARSGWAYVYDRQRKGWDTYDSLIDALPVALLAPGQYIVAIERENVNTATGWELVLFWN